MIPLFREKVKNFACFPLLLALLFFGAELAAQNLFPDLAPIYKDEVVARVDITLPPDSLAVILAPGNEQSDYHFHATFSFDNGTTQETFENVGFRLRGNTSRYSAKKSYKVSLNTYEPGRQWEGVEKLNLNGEHNYPTVSRAKVSWDLLRSMGVPAPRASHVEFYVNGEYFGLYANVEHIDEEFVESRFGNKDGNLYKCLYPADLKYLGSNPNLYKLMSGNRRVYDLKTNEAEDDYSDLAHFIDVLNNTPINDLRCELEPIFNINSFLLSMAYDILSGNWDGPLYNKNNFYLYHNQATGQFEYIPYDLDNTFGIDWFQIDWSTRNIYSWAHPNETRPLYWRILQVPEYRDRFSFYMNKIVQEVYTEAAMFDRLDEIKALIQPYLVADDYYTYDYGFDLQDFSDGFEESLPYFHTPVGFKPFISQRRTATLNQLDLNDIEPIVSQLTNNHPNEAQAVTIQAFIEDDQGVASVEVCYQLDGGSVNCTPLYDDGQHLDQDAGDGWYGAVIPALGQTGVLTYYVQATDLNGNDGREPVCGTREVFVGSAAVSLAINELMASNDATIADEQGEYDDWVEIYNLGNTSMYLGDRYLSDNPDNPTKWQFPDIWIEPGEFLLVWADDDVDQGELHAGFKLDADGDFVGIFDSDANGNGLIDGVDFGPIGADEARGRLPNGTGPFQAVNPTPGASNEPVAVLETPDGALVPYRIYPNPTRDLVYLQAGKALAEMREVLLLNALGQIVGRQEWKDQAIFDLSELPAGFYFLSLRHADGYQDLGRIVKE